MPILQILKMTPRNIQIALAILISIIVIGTVGFSLLEGEDLFVSLYWTISTITTLGYGDITPVTAPANSFSFLEAVIGQIYLVVTVARLVGINIAQSMDRKSG